MKTLRRPFVLATLLALGVASWSGLGSFAQEKAVPQQPKVEGKAGGMSTPPLLKWEYKITVLGGDDAATEKELNKLGDEGWELVGAPSDVSANRGGITVTKVRLIFKRPKN